MKEVANELIGLGEKVLDPNFKGENLDVLGLAIPSTLEDVGLFGAAVSVAKGAKVISDHFFAKNFEKFTNELGYITAEQKIKFYNKYSKKNIQDFGEQAILLLNKIEVPLAAKMMGKAHYLLVINEIDENVYLNYCYIIKQLNLYLLKNIKLVFENYNEIPESGGLHTTLFNLGLMQEAMQQLYPGSLPPKTYLQSQFGWDFYNHIIQPFINDF